MTINFDGIETATGVVKLPFVLPGKYVLRIDKLESFENRKKEALIGATFTVVKRLTPTGNDEGTRCSLKIKMTLDNSMEALNNLFTAALRGEKLTKERATALISESNPAAGVTVAVEAFNIMVGKAKDREFTKVIFDVIKK
jgi:hypothetical protein